MKAFVVALLLLAIPAFAEHKQPDIRHAKVISQDIGSYNGGAAVMPLGTGVIGVPITRHSNIVVLETNKARITLSEMPNKHFLILPVNGDVSFYVDKSLVILADGDGKKHKFSITHLETLAQQK